MSEPSATVTEPGPPAPMTATATPVLAQTAAVVACLALIDIRDAPDE